MWKIIVAHVVSLVSALLASAVQYAQSDSQVQSILDAVEAELEKLRPHSDHMKAMPMAFAAALPVQASAELGGILANIAALISQLSTLIPTLGPTIQTIISLVAFISGLLKPANTTTTAAPTPTTQPGVI